MLRLDEIGGENCENPQGEGWCHTRPTRPSKYEEGQTEMYAPMGAGCVSGSEPQEEDWKRVDEGRRGSMSHNYGMMGHVGKGKGNVKRWRRRQETCQRKKENDEGHGKEGYSQIFGGSKGGCAGEHKGRTRGFR